MLKYSQAADSERRKEKCQDNTEKQRGKKKIQFIKLFLPKAYC